jgi:iron-sulfur cluster protein
MPVNRPFRKKIRNALKNEALQKALGNFADAYPGARETAYRGVDFEKLREEIVAVKSHAIDHIETLSRRFEEKVRQRGGRVHRAANGKDVAAIIKEIAKNRNARLCVKSKSMATEEIHLNRLLEEALRVVETDLGEWIVQQIDERPSHMVMPAIHLSREECAKIFSDATGSEVEPDIPHMVKLARKLLRREFLAADIGITGCNIAVAETGTMVILTNEGNGRLTATLPPVHIVLMGYEKLIAQFKDIAPLVSAIPRSATCQPITSYVTMISAPCDTYKNTEDEETVPKELHVILLDNGRLELLKDPEFKQIGHCIRCASCLNVCPAYELVGGQVYGEVYSGGIGSLLTGFLSSHKSAEKIQELCLGCGKCLDYCPAGIDIPGLILKMRSRIRSKIPPPFLHRLVMNKVLPNKKLLDVSVKAARPAGKLIRRLPETAKIPFSAGLEAIGQRLPAGLFKGTVAFYYGCMIDYVYPEIGRAVVAVLNRAGYRVTFPEQKCCGAPSLYTGLEKSAARMAKEHLELWRRGIEHYTYIVTACPTCSVVLKKQWPRLLKDEPGLAARAELVAQKTIDFIQLVHQLESEDPFLEDVLTQGNRRPITVTYHDSCHLKWELGHHKAPRVVLSSAPGVEWIEMPESDRCCGFAGTYSIKLPEISGQLLNRKIENIKKSRANVVLTDCPGCLLSLKTGLEKEKSKILAQHSAVFLAKRLKTQS